MSALLAIAAVIVGLYGMLVLGSAKSALHEIEAFILFLIAAVLFASGVLANHTATIIAELKKLRGESDKSSQPPAGAWAPEPGEVDNNRPSTGAGSSAFRRRHG